MDLRNVDLKKILGLTEEEMTIAALLLESAKEAREAKDIIESSYLFKADEYEKKIWENGVDNYEILSCYGEWKGYYDGGKYKYRIDCSKESSEIEALFYAETLLKEGYVHPDDKVFQSNITYEEISTEAEYFHIFLNRIKEDLYCVELSVGKDKKSDSGIVEELEPIVSESDEIEELDDDWIMTHAFF